MIVLMLIAASSGLVFNAFTMLLPKLMQERLAGNAAHAAAGRVAAFLVTLCGALTQFTVGRMIDRTTLKTRLSAGQPGAGAGAGRAVLRPGLAGAAAGRRGGRRRSSARSRSTRR